MTADPAPARPSVEPLAGFTVAVTAARRREELTTLLERHGARVVQAPAIRIVPVVDDTLRQGKSQRENGVVTDRPLDRLRSLCLALPEVTERLSHGEPTWFVRDRKVFVTYADHHHDDRVGFWCAAPFGAQEALVAAGPERFFVPPYVGGRGWLGVRLDVPVDWVEIGELVTDAYRVVAPKRLAALLDRPRRGSVER